MVLEISFLCCHTGHRLSLLTKFGRALTDTHFDTYFLRGRGKEMLEEFKKGVITLASGGERKRINSLNIPHVAWEEEGTDSLTNFLVTGVDYERAWSNIPVCRHLKY